MQKVVLSLCLVFSLGLAAQTNISVTNIIVDSIVKGNYNPANYMASTIIDDHAEIVCMLDDELSADSLLGYLEKLETFHTRHTYSDTSSPDTGIGAARRWISRKFESFSTRNEHRLQVAYLSFDQPSNTCGSASGLKNVLGVLPGTDAQSPLVIIEAHMDTRCEGRCDTACAAPGIDDNGSGTALVMELARVMSRFTFEHTIVFMLTTGEEQGLLGATAMAEYCSTNNISIKAVQNNDVVGGIVCGQTASAPGCDPPYSVDSTTVRLYATPSFLQPHQGLARTIKMYYEEKMKSQVVVPMDIHIINQEDRIGRGGDHIPFRQRGFPSARFSSAHEHGDAGVNDPNYIDHQHTSRDVLGKDLDNDGILDTFYVDVNYLRRNTLINGVSLTMLAQGPESPDWVLKNEPTGLRVEITNGTSPEYRVGVRSAVSNAEFEAVYRFSGNSFVIPGQQNGTFYFVSVAAIDGNGVMSPFTAEQRALSPANTATSAQDSLPYGINCFLFGINEWPSRGFHSKVALLGVRPNPNRGEAKVMVHMDEGVHYHSASLIISENTGKEVKRLTLNLEPGENTVEFSHSFKPGVYYCLLNIDGQMVGSLKMIVE